MKLPMKLFKSVDNYTPMKRDLTPLELKAVNAQVEDYFYKVTNKELLEGRYDNLMRHKPVLVEYFRNGVGKTSRPIGAIADIINWENYPKDVFIDFPDLPREHGFVEHDTLHHNGGTGEITIELSPETLAAQAKAERRASKLAVLTSTNQGTIMNNEQNVVLTTETPLTENKGTTIKNSNQADMTAALHALTTELESGSITQEQFDILSTSIAEDMVTIEAAEEPEVTAEPSDWVPNYTLKDRLMDLAFNRALNMCQNHSDRFQVEAIIKPLMDATEDGYSPEAWLVALRQISQRMSDPKHHFTVARAINLTMRGITLSLNDRLAGQGKGFGTSHDAKLTHAQEELEKAEAAGDFEVARMIREDILELELNVTSEQETGTPYAGNSWNNSELPQDYDVLIDIANQYASGARLLYAKLNLGQSDDPMKFQVWSVNANIENPNEPPMWVDIESFADALDALESANARRNVQRKIDAELLATQVERARLDMSKAARTEKAVAAKKATAELAQQAIVKAKAKMVNNEIQRNLGLVEHMCNSYKASEITDKELAHAVMNIVADHDLLTPKTAEAFIVDYCERNELDVPTPA